MLCLKVLSWICLEENNEQSVRIIGSLTKIKTVYLPNISQEHCPII
jgi:hypothetical protein